MPSVLTVKVGTLDTPDAFVPEVAVFAHSRRAWDMLDPNVATFDEQPNWKPADPV